MEHRLYESEKGRICRAGSAAVVSWVKDGGGWNRGKGKDRRKHSRSVCYKQGVPMD